MERGSEAVDEALFSSEPRYFKMDRNSPQASMLRAAVTKMLFKFLGNYSDDVLAEYIVVLVCNGKHQNQARDDLDAFLGEGSGKFVAWLWHHLSEEIFLSRVPLEFSNLEAEVTNVCDVVMKNELKTTRLEDLHGSSVPISNNTLATNGTDGPSNLSIDLRRTINESESPDRWCPNIDVPLTEMNTDGTLNPTCTNSKNFGDSCARALKNSSSRVRYSPESLSVRNQYLQYENQVQKIVKSNSSGESPRPSPVPQTKPVARNLRSVIAEDLQSGSLSQKNTVNRRQPSAAMDTVTRPRGNVWDRLGKPCNNGDTSMLKDQYPSELEKMDHVRERLQKLRSSQEHNFNALGALDNVDISKRKRKLGDFSSGDNSASFSGRKEQTICKEPVPKLQGSLPIKNTCLQILDGSSEAKGANTLVREPACQSVKSARARTELEADKGTPSQLDKKALVTIQVRNLSPAGTSVTAKSGPVVIEDRDRKTSHRLKQNEASHVKSRLRQDEMDMLKRLPKKADMNMDAKVAASSGLQNHSEEDMESRTVLVTNVHFAARKENLLTHFSKCGVVLKVILLTDTVTAQPKGASYIVFASKESVEKALSMSGTSFFSRILTVMRKADMPSGFLVPAQLTVKPPQPRYSQPYTNGFFQWQPTGPHMQWRRDLATASREKPLSATTDRGSGQ